MGERSVLVVGWVILILCGSVLSLCSCSQHASDPSWKNSTADAQAQHEGVILQPRTPLKKRVIPSPNTIPNSPYHPPENFQLFPEEIPEQIQIQTHPADNQSQLDLPNTQKHPEEASSLTNETTQRDIPTITARETYQSFSSQTTSETFSDSEQIFPSESPTPLISKAEPLLNEVQTQICPSPIPEIQTKETELQTESPSLPPSSSSVESPHPTPSFSEDSSVTPAGESVSSQSTKEQGVGAGQPSITEKELPTESEIPQASESKISESSSPIPSEVKESPSSTPEPENSGPPSKTETNSEKGEHQNIKPKPNSSGREMRLNYASEDCGAKVLDASSGVRGLDSILSGSVDSYTLFVCSDNKWMVLELCEEVSIDVILIANLEYFSSTFQNFSVFGSVTYPQTSWELIGNFTAENLRAVQRFEVSKHKNPVFRYLKIQFLTHYGNEYYCPITMVQIYGSTLVEDLRQHVEDSNIKLQRFNEFINNANLDMLAKVDKLDKPLKLSENPPSEEKFLDVDINTVTFSDPGSQKFLFSDEDLPDFQSETIEKKVQELMESFLESEDSDERSANIFSHLANHLTKLEMRYSVLSHYIDSLESAISDRVKLLSMKQSQNSKMIQNLVNITNAIQHHDMTTQMHMSITELYLKIGELTKLDEKITLASEMRHKELILATIASGIFSTIVTIVILELINKR